MLTWGRQSCQERALPSRFRTKERASVAIAENSSSFDGNLEQKYES